MKSNKLWCIIALACLICGAVLCGAGFGLGGVLHDSYGIHYDADGFGIGVWEDEEDTKDNGANESKTIPLDAFSELHLDVAVGDIRIESGTSFSLQLEHISSDAYELKNDGKALYLQTWQESNGLHFLAKQADCEIVVTIPHNTTLEEVVVESNMGDVTISDVAAELLEVNQKLGDIELQDVYCETMTLDQKMGDVEYEGKHPGNLDVQNAMGDIDVVIEGSHKDYAYDLSASMGSIKANGHKRDGVSSSLSGGEHNAKYHITMHTSMGDINLEFGHD